MAQERATARVPAQETPEGLLRQLGVMSAAALVVSNMIGTGIFITSGFLAGQLGEPSLVLSVWVVGALCALAGAFCYSELGVNFPSSGGEYVYLTNAYGPAWGFMTGWISFVAGFSAPIAAAALAFCGYVGYFLPEVKPDAASQISLGPISLKLGLAQLVSCVLIGFLTLLNLFGLQRAAKFQNVFTALKVTVILALIIGGFAFGSGTFDNFSVPAVRTSQVPIVQQFAISLFWVYGSYSGWNAATYIAEELRKPERTLPLALTAGTLLVAAIYFGLNAVFIYAQPLEQLKGQFAIGVLTAQSLFGREVANVFGALMALALVSTVNAMVTIGPRVYYAMAKNRAFFTSAARVHPKWHTPVNAIVWQGIAAMLMTCIPFSDLFMYISFTLNLFAGLAVASLFVFRKRPGWVKLPVVSFLFPLLPGFFLVVSAWMYYVGMTVEPVVSLATLGTVGVGALFYHFRIRDQKPI